jgi:hypothetical protein
MKVSYKPVLHPTFNEAWTLILADSKGTRKSLIIHSEDLTNDVRIALTRTVPTANNEGLMMFAGGDATFTSDYDNSYDGPVYVRRATGSGSLTTLAVQEGY